MQERQLFFILGRERSGTTLLQNLLNNHTEIFIPDEAPFISFLVHKFGKETNISPQKFVTYLFQEPYIGLWNLDKTILLQRLKESEDHSFTSFCKIVLDYKNSKKASILGDKNPVHSVFTTSLAKTFTKAKFIWIVRDYRAQVNSMLKVDFERKNCTSLAIRWKKYNQEIQKLQRDAAERILQIRYEDLVINPKETLQEICVFLGVSYETGMDINNDSFNIRISEHHKSLQRKLTPENREHWKSELNEQQQQICEALAGDYGRQFGYEVFHNKKYRSFDISGFVLGHSYVPFLKIFQKLPIPLRGWIFRKLIAPNFSFWKNSKNLLGSK